MTPDELRALADALEPMAKAPCFDGININRAAAYLRQCADAQAEPKREPLSDGQVTDLWSWASGQDQGPETTQQHAFARAVERAAYERAAQECIETAAELRRCADGCTDGRYDWKADGADDCADAIRALGRQHD